MPSRLILLKETIAAYCQICTAYSV